MAGEDFVTARPPKGGEKRLVPVHYLQEPFNFKIPPSEKAKATTRVTEPGTDTVKKEARP